MVTYSKLENLDRCDGLAIPSSVIHRVAGMEIKERIEIKNISVNHGKNTKQMTELTMDETCSIIPTKI
jgi:hypothetical protein